MPCYHPIPAWRSATQVRLHKALPDSTPLHVPCGTCIGCRATRAQHWALRCQLEAQQHPHTSVATLTYGDGVPPTLSKRDFQLWMKRLREDLHSRIRYFACGEYGEKFGRPHYHAILFGLHHESDKMQYHWPHGHVYTDNVSIPAIRYVTHYTIKKGWNQPHWKKEERLDPETGELYQWQPPFQLMSRRPGIGAAAKQHYKSWAIYAISDGTKISIPRFYKNGYKETASPTEQEETEYQKYKHLLSRHDNQQTQQQLENKETIHYARQKLTQALRRYE